jgi:hypothetical protein
VIMTSAISPRLSKMLAVTIFFVLAWTIFRFIAFYAAARLNLGDEVKQLKAAYAEIAQRRVDIKILQGQLKSLTASPQAQHASIVAHDEHEALSRLMQTIRRSLEQARAQLLSLSQSATNGVSPVVGVQVRARLSEAQLTDWLSLVQRGEVSPNLDEINVTAENDGTKPSELVVAATLTAPWIKANKDGP